MIETLEDILEGIADACGIYGAHDEVRCIPPNKCCRACWVSNLRARVERAVEVIQKCVIEKEQYNESLRQHHERTYNNPALASANPQKRGL